MGGVAVAGLIGFLALFGKAFFVGFDAKNEVGSFAAVDGGGDFRTQ